MAAPNKNVARLRAAKLIAPGRLPTDYREALERMRESDVDGILLLKKRLDAAQRALGKGGQTINACFRPPL